MDGGLRGAESSLGRASWEVLTDGSSESNAKVAGTQKASPSRAVLTDGAKGSH